MRVIVALWAIIALISLLSLLGCSAPAGERSSAIPDLGHWTVCTTVGGETACG